MRDNAKNEEDASLEMTVSQEECRQRLRKRLLRRVKMQHQNVPSE